MKLAAAVLRNEWHSVLSLMSTMRFRGSATGPCTGFMPDCRLRDLYEQCQRFSAAEGCHDEFLEALAVTLNNVFDVDAAIEAFPPLHEVAKTYTGTGSDHCLRR